MSKWQRFLSKCVILGEPYPPQVKWRPLKWLNKEMESGQVRAAIFYTVLCGLYWIGWIRWIRRIVPN